MAGNYGYKIKSQVRVSEWLVKMETDILWGISDTHLTLFTRQMLRLRIEGELDGLEILWHIPQNTWP